MGTSKDHYVAQTYLEKFCDADSKLWIYNKEWGTVKDKTTGQVCYEHGGSDNPYLTCSRAVEEYLKPFEKNWSSAVEVFTSNGNIDFKTYINAKRLIAGYVPYLRFFTPAAIRTQKATLTATVKTSLKILNKMGKIPSPPVGCEFILEDIEKYFDVDIDSNYTKAIAAGVLQRLSVRLFKFPWMRIENRSNVPFITSDNPTCFWYTEESNIPFTYFSMTPKFGILIKPFINDKDCRSYDHTDDKKAIAKPEFVSILNELVIKNAERIIIANNRLDSLRKKITTLRNWRYECRVDKVKLDNGELIVSRMDAVETVI